MSEVRALSDAATCAHVSITTFGDGEGGPRLWACDDCRVRFYPACPVCVDIGHRNIDHLYVTAPVAFVQRPGEPLEPVLAASPSPDTDAGLDVATLRALREAILRELPSLDRDIESRYVGMAFDRAAMKIGATK